MAEHLRCQTSYFKALLQYDYLIKGFAENNLKNVVMTFLVFVSTS